LNKKTELVSKSKDKSQSLKLKNNNKSKLSWVLELNHFIKPKKAISVLESLFLAERVFL
jgi:hypothetical protein